MSVGEQLRLFRYVATLIPADSQVWVMGDAGFESVHLLHWLRGQGWSFVIRQSGRTLVRWPNQDWVKLNQLPIAEGQTRTIGWVRLTQKYDVGWFFLVLHWDKGEEEPWFLVSNKADTRLILRHYRIRMWIEEMYGDMKGHGFDLEATHLADADRISRLVLAVCLTFVWLITLGSWVVKRGFRHFLDHKSRRDKSYFRLGWDWMERCLRLNQPVPIHFSPCF
ncbi:MAG: transposase [Anaerolineae bacterium]|nr:transposase [Anaerolineae bacterium]